MAVVFAPFQRRKYDCPQKGLSRRRAHKAKDGEVSTQFLRPPRRRGILPPLHLVLVLCVMTLAEESTPPLSSTARGERRANQPHFTTAQQTR
jgi:hypothetical protein